MVRVVVRGWVVGGEALRAHPPREKEGGKWVEVHNCGCFMGIGGDQSAHLHAMRLTCDRRSEI